MGERANFQMMLNEFVTPSIQKNTTTKPRQGHSCSIQGEIYCENKVSEKLDSSLSSAKNELGNLDFSLPGLTCLKDEDIRLFDL